MHKEQYKQVLSGVGPSEQCIERILVMTENKTKRIRKGWIIAAAALLVLLCALFTANAATDGALFRGELFQSLRVILNGKEYRLDDYVSLTEEMTDKDGNAVVHYSYALPDGKSIDAYAAENYTAFSADADDLDSMQIVAGDADKEPVTE